MDYPVGEVARLAGVTVRTLHHYEEIGLLVPSARTASGYRLYADADIERLQQILFYRELGFSLTRIAELLDDPTADAMAHLTYQRQLLTERIGRLQAMVAAVDQAMEDKRMGTEPSPEERFAAMTGVTLETQAEFHDRWGDSPIYQEANRRAAALGEDEMAEAMAGRRAWVARLQAAMDAGLAPDSPEAMDIAEVLRQSGMKHFGYPDTHDWHLGVVQTYVDRPDSLGLVVLPDEQRPGMAEFLRDAARANAARAGYSA